VPAEVADSKGQPDSLSDPRNRSVGGATDQRLSLERQEHRSNVLRFRVGLVVAVPIWILFAVLD
jgi:hypothetical protein